MSQFLIFGLVLFLLSSCDLIGELREDRYEYISKSQLYIGELTLFAEKEKMINYLGKPDSSSQGLYYYDGVNVLLSSDSQIWEINCTSPKYSTPDGIKVGDPKDKVIKNYGETEVYKDEEIEELDYQKIITIRFSRISHFISFSILRMRRSLKFSSGGITNEFST